MKINRFVLLCTLVLCVLSCIASPKALGQDNGSGGEPIVNSIDPSTLTYDYLVDGNLTADDPAHNKFMTLQAAYAAAPAGTSTRQTVIGIMPNVYQIPGTALTPGLTITKNYITLRGLTNDRRTVVLADNRGNKEGAGSDTQSDDGYVIVVNANGFNAENLTFLNYCNVDYEYPGDPSKNLTARSHVITQAVALQASGDQHKYTNVAILSRLDTMFLQTTRSYFQNLYLEGTDDFLGGGTISVIQDSYIYFPTGSGVMSASGVTFINTTFSATNGMQFYKGAGSPVTLINCTVPVDTSTAHVAWVDTGFAPASTRPNLYTQTYHVKDTNGNPAVIVDNSKGTPPTFLLSKEISDSEALAYNPWNLLRATPTGTADNWDPAGVQGIYDSTGQGNLIYRLALTNANPTIMTGQTGATIGATVAPTRASDKTLTWSTTSSLVTLSSTTGASITVTGNNNTLAGQYVPINVTTVNGYTATFWAFVNPKFIDPPAVTSNPTLSGPVNGIVSVNYSLNLGPLQDQSLISWFSCDDASGSNPRPIAVSRGNIPLSVYPLVLGDVGRFIQVTIQPKSNISNAGAVVSTILPNPILISDIKSPIVNPNFANLPTNAEPAYISGYWTVLGSWTSSSAPNYVNGFGFRVAKQASSLLYQQDGSFGDMQVDLYMSPEKTGGQGFGSPGSSADGDTIQKSDIYIKYDPRTKNGYSLRYWRTTSSTTAVNFQFFKIVNGVGSPLDSQQQLTGVFKPDTMISVSVVGSTITAVGSNTADSDTLFLQSTISPNAFGGAGVYWSGTVPTGNSNVYSMIRISYPGTNQLTTTAKLIKADGGGYQADVTVTNHGSGTVQNVQINSATLGTASGISAPVFLGNILANSSVTTTINFPASAGVDGAGVAEKYSGSYTGGTFSGSIRAQLP